MKIIEFSLNGYNASRFFYYSRKHNLLLFG